MRSNDAMSERNLHPRHVGLLTALVLWSCAATSGAVPQIESGFGGQNAFLLPEINAMGGTGVTLYRGGMSGLLNPAMLTAEKGLRLDLATSLDHQDEDRFQPLFDTFDSYVTDAAIASNRHDHWGGGLALAGRVADGAYPIVMSLSLADRYAFGYAFDEEIRDPDSGSSPRDQILEDRSYEVKGALRDLSLGAATDVLPGYSLGVAVNYAFGSRDEVWSRRFYDTPDSSYVRTAQWDPSGVNATVGLRIRVSPRLDIGAAYETPLSAEGDLRSDLNDTLTTTVTTKVRYPGEYRVGLAVRPRNDPRTTIAAEIAYREWSELEDSRAPGGANLEDVVDVRLGVEHTFNNAMRMLFGFRHYDSYLDRETGASVFTGGVNTPLGAGSLVVSLELSKLTSRDRPHVFPYPDGVDGFGNPITGGATARVEDTRMRVGLGYSRSF
jgi:hypothetical protein